MLNHPLISFRQCPVVSKRYNLEPRRAAKIPVVTGTFENEGMLQIRASKAFQGCIQSGSPKALPSRYVSPSAEASGRIIRTYAHTRLGTRIRRPEFQWNPGLSSYKSLELGPRAEAQSRRCRPREVQYPMSEKSKPLQPSREVVDVQKGEGVTTAQSKQPASSNGSGQPAPRPTKDGR